jgi:anti-sigma factor RsiW
MTTGREKEIKILEKQTLACRDVDSLMSDYVDLELLPSTQSRVADHISTCERCAEGLEDMKLVIELARTFSTPTMPRGVRTRLRQHLNSTLGLNLSTNVE